MRPRRAEGLRPVLSAPPSGHGGRDAPQGARGVGPVPDPRDSLSARRAAAGGAHRGSRDVTIKKLSIPLLGQPDPNVPSDVHLVGRYAIGVTWADTHGSIYP